MSVPRKEWFRYAETAGDLMVAVARVFLDKKAAADDPAAERWVTNDHYFRELRATVISQWASVTKLDRRRFPFNDDYVRWAWLTYRKDAGGEKGELLRWAQGRQPSLFQ